MARQVSLRGKRFSAFDKPSSWRTHVHQVGGVAAVEHAEALGRGRRACSGGGSGGWRSSGRCPTRAAGTLGFFATSRDDALRAARHLERRAAREGEQQDALRARRPPAIRCATRCASVLVLPVPAPATISSGALPAQAASRCRGLSLSNASIAPTAGDYRLNLYGYPVLRAKKNPTEVGL